MVSDWQPAGQCTALCFWRYVSRILTTTRLPHLPWAVSQRWWRCQGNCAKSSSWVAALCCMMVRIVKVTLNPGSMTLISAREQTTSWSGVGGTFVLSRAWPWLWEIRGVHGFFNQACQKCISIAWQPNIPYIPISIGRKLPTFLDERYLRSL